MMWVKFDMYVKKASSHRVGCFMKHPIVRQVFNDHRCPVKLAVSDCSK